MLLKAGYERIGLSLFVTEIAALTFPLYSSVWFGSLGHYDNMKYHGIRPTSLVKKGDNIVTTKKGFDNIVNFSLRSTIPGSHEGDIQGGPEVAY